MRTFATMALTSALLAWSAPATAQMFGFGAHAGVSIPTGDYSDVADVGFSGGLDLTLPLPAITPALSWYTSVDAAGHSASADQHEGGFLIVPVLTGARLDVGGLGMLRPFLTGQVGVAFARGPEIAGVSGDTNSEFAWGLGGGLQLTSNVYGGLKWFNLGDVTFTPGPATSVSFLDIYLGFGVR